LVLAAFFAGAALFARLLLTAVFFAADDFFRVPPSKLNPYATEKFEPTLGTKVRVTSEGGIAKP
jgi:hypothetical protein